MPEGLGLFVALTTLLAVSASALAQPSDEGALGAWRAASGRWRATRQGMTGEGHLDNRLIRRAESPESFEWTVEIRLQEGWSAGALFWATEDGSQAYCARLDSRLGQLVLSRLGPWPEETRLASFPWEPQDGPSVRLRIVAGNGSVRVYAPARGKHPLLEARKADAPGRHLGLRVLDARAAFRLGEARAAQAPTITAHVPRVGTFTHIYDPSVGESESWYINDHCFIRGADGWHLYGITHAKPAAPLDEKSFAHATSPELLRTPWTKQPDALRAEESRGEQHLWAPHVIRRGDTFYMFYCAGSLRGNYHYQINLATSKDLKTWTRRAANPLFQDFFDARDPMVYEEDGTYYLYYTATLDKEQNHHVVSVRTSKDLIRWSPARVALTHPSRGTFGGPTESPFVVRYGDHYYLFCGPDGDYRRTVVYRSPNPYHWEYSQQIYAFPSHAAEVVQDGEGRWYASNCGWDADGVYLAPLEWQIDEGPSPAPAQ